MRSPLLRRGKPAWLLCTFLIVACGPPDGGDATTDCAPNGSCPVGFVCEIKTNKCRLAGSVTADGGGVDAARGDAGETRAPDAGVPDTEVPDAPRSAALSVSPESQDFAEATLGAVGPPLTFTVTNSGDLPSGAITASSDDPSFAIAGGSCVGAPLAGRAQCTVLVQFGPSGEAGPKAGTLTIGAGPGAPMTVPVTGTAITPGAITIVPTSKDFGGQPIHTASAELLFTVRNTGQSPTGTLAVRLSDTTRFAVSTNDCKGVLAGGATCTIGLIFTPTDVGPIQGAALTVSATPGGNAAAALQGTGTAQIKVVNAGGGTVTSTPAGISCGAACAATYTTSPVILTAVADAQHTFTGWSAPCSGTGTCEVPLTVTTTLVTATFALKPAALVLAPAAHDFGSVVLGGTSSVFPFSVTNTGGATAGTLSASAGDAASYTVAGGTCAGALLTSGASCTVNVKFNPSGAAGPKPSTLTVSGTPGGSTTATLSGTALVPGTLSISSTSKDFGAVGLGAVSAAASFTITNHGEAPTGTPAPTLSDTANFTISANGCTAPLDAGASCTVAVAFKPASVGLKSGVSLTVAATPGGSVAAALQGTGTAQATVVNAGGGTVTSTPAGISCGATCAATFSTSPVTLAAVADAQHTFTGWSAPCSGTGACALPLTAASNPVTATFALRPAALAIAPATQSFGSVVLGGSSAPIAFTVTNTGGESSGSLSAGVSDAASYAVTGGTCAGAALASGATCTVNVKFAPTGAAGAKPATLTVSGTPGGSTAAALSGTALTPGALTISSTAKDFGSLALGGTSAPASFTITNGGGAPTGTLATSLSDSTHFTITSNGCAAALDAGASCAVAVAFKPASVGLKSGVSLTVSATPGGSVAAALQGTGTAQANVVNAGGGTVTSAPAGISCGATCAASFTTSPVTLTAVADAQHTFTGWSAPCSGTGTCALPLTAATNPVTASFALKPAALALAPATHDFGSVVLGSSTSPFAFTVTNSGGETSGALAASASDGASYSVTGGTCLGATLASGATCTVSVRFNPSGAAGSKPATLTVSGAPGGSPTATLSGTALAPAALTISATSKDFGSVGLGGTSAPSSFTITNGGGSPTGTPAVTLSDSTNFTLTSNTCTAALDAGASCAVGVAFKPASVGLKSGASLTVTATPGGSVAATLQGTGTAQATVVNAGGGTVTSAPAGISCGAACTATFTSSPVTLTAVADAQHTFTGWSAPCSGTGTCALALTAATNQVTATFALKPAALAVVPTTHDFGSVVLGGSTSPFGFTVTNNGGATSGTLGASVSDPASYAVTGGTCIGATLASGATCDVSVKFNPTGAAGAKPATLTISGAPGGTATLSGTALAPAALTIAPATKDYGSVNLGGTSAATTFTITNGGGAPTGTLTTGLSDSTHFTITANGCAAALAAGASCTVGVAFSPASVGQKSGVTLTVSGTPGGSVSATVQGAGTAQAQVVNAGGGTVTSTPTGLSCGATCTATFSVSPVTLIAVADAQHTFTGWSSPCVGTGPCNLPLVAATNQVTATFALKPAALSVAPTTHDFGSVVLGSSTADFGFTVSNTGGGTSGTLGATVSDTASYAVTGGSCIGATLAAGATCGVNVKFNPTGAAGAKPATLTISGAPGGTTSATLSGTALTPAALSISATSKDFGSVSLGSTSATTSFTITNGGGAPTGTPATTLSDSTNFTILANTCTAALAAGATCTVGVAFKPASVGLKSGVSLTVAATPGGSVTATLQGTGTAQAKVVNAGGGGTVTSTPAGISCGATCTATFTSSPVTLTAVADAQHDFTGWSAPCSGTGPCNLALVAATNQVTATFTLKPMVTVTVFDGLIRKIGIDVVSQNAAGTTVIATVKTDDNGRATVPIQPGGMVSAQFTTHPNNDPFTLITGATVTEVQPGDDITLGRPTAADHERPVAVTRTLPPPLTGASCYEDDLSQQERTGCGAYESPKTIMASADSLDSTGLANWLTVAFFPDRNCQFGWAPGIAFNNGVGTATVTAWRPGIDGPVHLVNLPGTFTVFIDYGVGMNGLWYQNFANFFSTAAAGNQDIAIKVPPPGVGQAVVYNFATNTGKDVFQESPTFDPASFISPTTNVVLTGQSGTSPFGVTYTTPAATGVITAVHTQSGNGGFDTFMDWYFVTPANGRIAAPQGAHSLFSVGNYVQQVVVDASTWSSADFRHNFMPYLRQMSTPPAPTPWAGPGSVTRLAKSLTFF